MSHSEFALLARYNQWMNERLYAAAAQLTSAELQQNRGAFFGSIMGTLNHVMVGDLLWLRRFATHPAGATALTPVFEIPKPDSLDQILFADLAALTAFRQRLDAVIRDWVGGLSEATLNDTIEYANVRGVVSRRKLGSLLLHFFNHQTHHRGQATTLLSQAGLDVGITDLLVLIPDELSPTAGP